MKFASKLIIGTTSIIAVLFSVGGTSLIRDNFMVAYENQISQNRQNYILYRYSLESSIRNQVENRQELSKELVESQAEKIFTYGNTVEMVSVWLGEEEVYSSIKEGQWDEVLLAYCKNPNQNYLVKAGEQQTYMYLASKITILDETIIIMNGYDISPIFEERGRQTDYFLKWFGIVIGIYMLVIVIFFRVITAPIKRLNTVSTKIADGCYEERTRIKSSDEIGELSKNFDQMAEAIQVKIMELEEEAMRKEAFISDFSHELKTPMTTMMGYSKLMVENQLDPSMTEKAANYIYAQCKRLDLLSRRLLSLLSIDGESITLQSIQVAWLQKKVEEIAVPMFADGKVRWSCELEEGYLVGDGTLLVTLCKNLIENGKRACNNASSKKELAVRMMGRRVDDGYELIIEDNGCGIKNEELDFIMQPFYQVEKARNYQRDESGTGLGLSISQKIATVHQTNLEFESKFGVGTRVRILLALAKEENE